MKYRFNGLVFVLLAVVLTACGGGGQVDSSGFSVVSTSPPNNAIGVDVKTTISVTLSSPVTMESVSLENVTLQDQNSGLLIDGTVTIESSVISFKPNNDLNSNANYELTIPADFSAEIDQQLIREYRLSFSTSFIDDRSAPQVVSTIPPANALNVFINSGVSVTFNESIKSTSVVTSGIYEYDPIEDAVGEVITSTFSPLGDTLSLSFADLTLNSEYIVILSDITDVAGNKMERYEWRFRTGDVLDIEKPEILQSLPLIDAANIPITRPISVTFSEEMDRSKLTNRQFTLTNLTTGSNVIGSVGYANRIATFNIQENNERLEFASEYEVNIDNVADLAGNALKIIDSEGNELGGPFRWRFSTNSENQAAPEVVTSQWDELSNGSGVSLTTRITVTFSETVLPESITPDSIVLEGVSGDISFDDDRTVVFTPSQSLVERTEYTFKVSTEVLDEDLKPLASEYVVTFMTGDVTRPVVQESTEFPFPNKGATDVAKNAEISLALNELLDDSGKETYLTVSYGGGAVSGSTEIAGRIIRFKPDNNFPENTLVNVVVNTTVQDLAGNTLAEPYSWTFTSGDTLAPAVQSVIPGENQTIVPINSNVIVSFLADELLAEASITDATFFLTNNETSTKVPATISVTRGRIELDPLSDLAEKTQYEVTVGAEITDAAGQKISSPRVWVFTTEDKTAPIVETRSPGIDEKNVAVDTSLSVSFSEEIISGSVTRASFYLVDTLSGEKISTTVPTVTQEGSLVKATLKPESPLVEQNSYTVYLTDEIHDLFGNGLEATDWVFTVGDFTAPKVTLEEPANNTTNVEVNPLIVVGFDEPMDQASVEEAFSISPVLEGDFSWIGNSVTFTPLTNLVEQQKYEVVVSRFAKDESGNALNSQFVWDFTIGDFTAPEIVSVSPENLKTGVGKITPISVTFSENMDSESTIAAFSIDPMVQGEVALAGNVLTFSPSESMFELETYTVTLQSTATDMSQEANSLADPMTWSFVIGDFTFPTGEISLITDELGRVSTTPVFKVTFSESVTAAVEAFQLIGNSVGVELSVVWFNDNTLAEVSLLSGALIEQASYQFAVNADLVTDNRGNLLSPVNSMDIVVGDFTAPVATINLPSLDALSRIDRRPSWTVDFSEAVVVDGTAFFLNPVSGGDERETVALSVSWSDDRTMATLSLAEAESDLVDRGNYSSSVRNESLKDLTGNVLASAVAITFEVGDFVSPRVIENTPFNDSERFQRSAKVSVTFNEKMNVSSVTSGFSVVDVEGNSVEGDIENNNGVNFTFTPRSEGQLFGNFTSYTVTLSTSITDITGNELSESLTWSFLTNDDVGPRVTAQSPMPGASNTPVNSLITVIFDEPMNMSLTESAFQLSLKSIAEPATYTNIEGEFIRENSETLKFSPNVLLEERTYRVFVDSSVAEDANGQPLTSISSWEFTIGDETAPSVVDIKMPAPVSTDGANGLPRQGEIVVTFSEVVNVASNNFELLTEVEEVSLPSLTMVAETIEAGQTVVRLSPAEALTSEVNYVFVVKAGIEDDSENKNVLTADSRVDFQVEDYVRPLLLEGSRIPNPGAEKVGNQQMISMSFNENMDKNTTSDAFSITPNVDGVISVAGNTLTFSPSEEMSSETKYTISLSGLATDDSGNLIQPSANLSWSFTIEDYQAPRLISSSRSPAPGSTEVKRRANVSLSFSEIMDAKSTVEAFSISPNVSGELTFGENRSSLIFRPSEDLTSETLYIIRIATTAMDDAGNEIQPNENLSWSFRIEDYTPPLVNSTTPGSGSVNVALNSGIDVTFNEAMTESSVTASSFSVNGGGSSLEGSFGWNETGTKFTFKPDQLLTENTKYAVTITTGVEDANGVALASNVSWVFTTAATAPTIISTLPTANGTNASLGANIEATFSEPMMVSTVTSATFTLINTKSPSSPVTGVVTLSGGNKAIFNPSSALAENTIYRATITTGVTDANGVALASNVSWVFTTTATAPTVISTLPTANGTNVNLGANIEATFSEPMMVSTVTSATFTLINTKSPSSSVTGVVTLSGGNKATFNPSSAFIGGETYTATLTTGVMDSNGVTMVSDHSWSFTTERPVPPDILSTTPPANGVAVTRAITINFSEPVNTDAFTGVEFNLLLDGSDVRVTEGDTSDSASSMVYTLDDPLEDNALYRAEFSGLLTDVDGDSQLVEVIWQFTTGSLVVGAFSGSSTPVFSSYGIDSSASHNFVVTGLRAGRSYGVSLTGIDDGVNLDLSTYRGVFSSLVCRSNYLDTNSNTNEVCFAEANANGEVYIEVQNLSGFATRLTLEMAESTVDERAVDNNYDLTGFVNIISGRTSIAYLVDDSGDLDFYAFGGGSNGRSSVCRSFRQSAGIRNFCVIPSGISGGRYLVDGRDGNSSYRVRRDTVSRVPLSSSYDISFLSPERYFFHELTGLTVGVTYEINMVTTRFFDLIDDDFNLAVYTDEFRTLDCLSDKNKTGTESCQTTAKTTSLFVVVDTFSSANGSSVSFSVSSVDK